MLRTPACLKAGVPSAARGHASLAGASDAGAVPTASPRDAPC
jgi:hypothetical protein